MPAELPNITREWIDKVFGVQPDDFEELTFQIFYHQYQYNKIYAQYADAVGRPPQKIKQVEDIPFLPISFFKTHQVVAGNFEAQVIFESSGTTQTVNSRHYVKDLQIYERSFMQGFEQFYGKASDYCILGLLPSYLERNNSSLVLMMDELVKQSAHADSGFYLYNHEKLYEVMQALEQQQQKTILLGVSFGLLDFAEKYQLQLQHTTVVETGGMKGRREEWTRQQVHDFLCDRFGVSAIHSEYGMTELLSQAWSYGNGIFNCPPWMKIVLRGEDDPFSVQQIGSGIVNIIDLANIHSCSFIATDDAGKAYDDGSFEIIGRTDNSDLRGCSLMAV